MEGVGYPSTAHAWRVGARRRRADAESMEGERASARGRVRVAGERGFTLVELMVAIFIATTALLAIVGAIDASRKLTTTSERKEAATHVAEQEIERILSYEYGEIVMTSPAPTRVNDELDPRYYVTDGGGGGDDDVPMYRWNHKDDAPTPHTEPLVLPAADGDANDDDILDPAPRVTSEASSWNDGRLSGKVHRFVTWVDDAGCGIDPVNLCPGTEDYKRVTVAVTIDGEGGPNKPIVISTLVSNPNTLPPDARADGNQNPLAEPSTKCRDSSGNLVDCRSTISGAAKSWFLYDTPSSSQTRQTIAGDHATHPTIAPWGTCSKAPPDSSGCPVPDLMEDEPAPTADPLPPVYDYSSEITGVTYAGGRILRRDVSCSETPSSTDNTMGQMWVSNTLAPATTLSGDGGLTLFSQTASGVTAAGTVCVAFYDVPESIEDLVEDPPTEIGRASFTDSTWPTAPSVATFAFDFRGSNGPVLLPAGHRIGMRVWAASSSGADLALLYDHPSYPASVQLNTE